MSLSLENDLLVSFSSLLPLRVINAEDRAVREAELR